MNKEPENIKVTKDNVDKIIAELVASKIIFGDRFFILGNSAYRYDSIRIISYNSHRHEFAAKMGSNEEVILFKIPDNLRDLSYKYSSKLFLYIVERFSEHMGSLCEKNNSKLMEPLEVELKEMTLST